ncbi:LOW QUALITY PROTEIN: hypothetical protein BC937DRAFT_87501 [Endogone sp. FLAS-F59071]|nr:LOW QUALITY PROTEIN: hypothetical protein BC937DRAFT_87501 [Endogone sp. FLAS-F59071]|eukprot:RUS19428.1 LOW QUALITY PROTEIN: hypothetical protein BC937DRAFT_87501 [Endogone sp. FLAS-F59071]
MAFLSGVLKSSLQLLTKDGLSIPYTLGEKVEWYEGQSIWSLHHGTKKDDGTPVSIFAFDCQKQRDRIPLAKNAFKKMRTIRHPDLLKYLDGVENEQVIYIVTEMVEPVQNQLRQDPDANLTLWGLYKVANAIKFLNTDCSLVHGNVRLSSIFATKAGEWKLGGFELLGSPKEEGAVILTFGGLVPDSSKYASPETRKSGWSIIKDIPIHSTDAWLYACLIYESYNGSFTSSDQLTTRKEIPTNMFTAYKGLLAPGPASRTDLNKFLEQGTRASGFFQTDFLQVNLFLENLSIKEQKEKEGFYRKLDSVIEHFPMEFCKNKILPELLNAFEYGSGGAKVLSPIVKIGAHLTDEEYERTITASIVKMFASPDRTVRLSLLENLPSFVDHLGNKAVNDKIFPNVATGFTDGAPIVREQTVKAILLLIPKLSERIINYDLLRYLAKLQVDEEPGIRTNTTICLGKIARYLSDAVGWGWALGGLLSIEEVKRSSSLDLSSSSITLLDTRKKVLVPAFTRGLRDGFIHARIASLMALNATAEYYDAVDCATKIVPCVSLTLVDKEKPVRLQAFKTIDMFVKKLDKLVESMPDTAIQEQPQTVTANGSTSPTPSAPGAFPTSAASAAAGAAAGAAVVVGKEAASWAGWAVTSLATRLTTTGEITATDTTIASTAVTTIEADVPDPTVNSNGSGAGASVGGLTVVAARLAVTDDAGAGDGWGDDNLINLNENEEWEPFETPAELQPTPVSDFAPGPARATTASPKIGSFGAMSGPAKFGTTTPSTGTAAKGSMRLGGGKAKSKVPDNWGLDDDSGWNDAASAHTITSNASRRSSNEWADVSDGGGGWSSPSAATDNRAGSPVTALASKEERMADLERKREERRQDGRTARAEEERNYNRRTESNIGGNLASSRAVPKKSRSIEFFGFVGCYVSTAAQPCRTSIVDSRRGNLI